uniref:Uncharacterized protein n=1 Tax=Oryza meridionalis TaxID=40149 RepID=A0A0E0CUT8_9ORYZ
MGSEIATVPDTLCANISNDLAEISKRMMDLAAQVQALAAQSAEQAMSLGAAERSDQQAVMLLGNKMWWRSAWDGVNDTFSVQAAGIHRQETASFANL